MLDVVSKRQFRDWFSNLPPNKQTVIAKLIIHAQNTLLDETDYVFPKTKLGTFYAVLEDRKKGKKVYLVYKVEGTRVILYGSGLTDVGKTRIVFDFEIHERDALILSGRLPPPF
jgi:hypothetical protein